MAVPRRLCRSGPRPSEKCQLILHREAGDPVALEIAAGGLGAALVETAKAGAVQRFLALDHPLDERVGATDEILGEALGRLQVLARLVLVREGADLDHPASVRLRLLDGGQR